MSADPYILMYHAVTEAVGPEADPFQICVSPERLDQQLRWLTRRGLRGVSVRELLAAEDRRRLVGLTFDDGYVDFHTNALPILRRHGFTASVYAVVDRIGADNGWEEYGPQRLLMDAAQLRDCAAAGMEIGSHGLRHVRMSGAGAALQAAEIGESRERLHDLLGEPIDGYCYSYGDLDDHAVATVRAAGYDYGCAIWRGANTGRYALPRTYVGARDTAWRLLAKQYRARLRGGPVPLAKAPTEVVA